MKVRNKRPKSRSNNRTRIKRLAGELQGYSWWHLVTLTVGVLSFISLLVVLFLPLSKGPTQFTYAGELPSPSEANFIRPLSESLNLPIGEGEKLQTLNNGSAFLDLLLKDVDSARSSINIMMYIWTDGQMSDRLIDHLSAKVREGVQVRVILDSFGSNWWERPTKKLKSLVDAGAKVEVFRSLTIAPWDFLKNHLRNHRRSIVIDGRIGYTGGMAINDAWLGDARNSKEIRDMMFRVTGQMARSLQGVFSELWAGTTGELLSGEQFYPTAGSSKGAIPYVTLPSTPTPDTLVLQRFILLSLASAKKKIYITSPYFLPDLSLRELLVRKARAGVEVKVLVPNHLNDSRAVYHASRDSYDELLAGGVQIFEYQPSFIHAKSLVVDGSWVVVGSANMDNRSRKLNEEAVFGILDKEFSAELEKIFAADLSKAVQIELAAWRKRGIVERVQELAAKNFIEQY